MVVTVISLEMSRWASTSMLQTKGYPAVAHVGSIELSGRPGKLGMQLEACRFLAPELVSSEALPAE
jgi:hypothetical protein